MVKGRATICYVLRAAFTIVTLGWWGENERTLFTYLFSKCLLNTNCVLSIETVVQKLIRQVPDLEDLTFSGRGRRNIRKGNVQFQYRANHCDGVNLDLGSGKVRESFPEAVIVSWDLKDEEVFARQESEGGVREKRVHFRQ